MRRARRRGMAAWRAATRWTLTLSHLTAVAGTARLPLVNDASRRTLLTASAPRVLYEDDDVLALHKRPGQPYHTEGEQLGVLRELRQAQERGELGYHGPLMGVHRLDTVTSGVLLVAKGEWAQRELSIAFEQRRVDKYYVALSARKPHKKEGRVVGDMQKGRRGSYMLLRSTYSPAITHFTHQGLVLPERPGLRAILLKPESGRTHQLRVACKALGAPILGDERYANAADARGEDRCYLHAAAIRVGPLGGRERPIAVLCPPAEGALFRTAEFERLWAALFPPSELLRGQRPAAPEARPDAAAAGSPWGWAQMKHRFKAAAQAVHAHSDSSHDAHTAPAAG